MLPAIAYINVYLIMGTLLQCLMLHIGGRRYTLCCKGEC